MKKYLSIAIGMLMFFPAIIYLVNYLFDVEVIGEVCPFAIGLFAGIFTALILYYLDKKYPEEEKKSKE